jgi:NTE family protein
MNDDPEPKAFGLALGGGGARGSVHIGILIELEKQGLRPDIVTGTSIGGLVGALIATGLNSEEITEFFRHMRFGKMYAMPWQKPALMDTRRLKSQLLKTIGHRTFKDLEIPLALVTTDLVNRVETVIEDGDVVSAVLATTAFPVIFPPVERVGLTLIDGGVLNNTPFDVAMARGAQHVLAIDLSNSAPYGTKVPYPPRNNILTRFLTRAQRDPMYQATSTLADIMTAQNVNENLQEAQPDLFLRPDVGSIGLFDFHRLEEGIAAGQIAAYEARSELNELAESVEATRQSLK